VIVRVYQLGSKAAFEQAEFYPLYNTDAAALGPDLVKKEEWLVTPGSSKSTTFSPGDSVRAVGVFGAYSDFQNATWRATADIPPHQTTKLAVTADRGGIRLTVTREEPAGH
jgi:type VI secretion system protein VasD